MRCIRAAGNHQYGLLLHIEERIHGSVPTVLLWAGRLAHILPNSFFRGREPTCGQSSELPGSLPHGPTSLASVAGAQCCSSQDASLLRLTLLITEAQRVEGVPLTHGSSGGTEARALSQDTLTHKDRLVGTREHEYTVSEKSCMVSRKHVTTNNCDKIEFHPHVVLDMEIQVATQMLMRKKRYQNHSGVMWRGGARALHICKRKGNRALTEEPGN